MKKFKKKTHIPIFGSGALFVSDFCAVAVETRDSAVANDVPNSVVDALDGHHIRYAFEHLQLDGTIATLVSRLGDDLRTELARDVGFLISLDVTLF